MPSIKWLLSKEQDLVKAEVDEAEADVVEGEDDEKALELEVNKCEMLNYIMQKLLLAPKYKEDNQRNKIFWTCGTINDKMYNVIFYNGRQHSSEETIVGVVSDSILIVQFTEYFIRLTNKILKPFSYRFVVGYSNDILVFSLDMVMHLEYLRMVMKVLRKNKLYINMKNYNIL